MVGRLMWREIRGLFRYPAFDVVMGVLIIVGAIWGSRGVLTIGRMSFAYFFVAMSLVGDVQSKEIEWLFLLPVRRRTIFLSKYLAGFPFLVFFVLLPSVFSTGSPTMLKICLDVATRFSLHSLYYTFLFVMYSLAISVLLPK